MAFPYPPLPVADALRLLILKPGKFFDGLEGDLVPVAFSERPKYLALSYTWDNPTPEQPNLPATFTKRTSVRDGEAAGYPTLESPGRWKEPILDLNGHDIPIGHNLALALRYLRSANHPLTLWVDAVCINQSNIDERNAQVALMALIYSCATAVVAWLGLNGPEVLARFIDCDPDGVQIANAMRDVYERGNSKELAAWFAEHISASSRTGSRNPVESRVVEEDVLGRLAAINQHGTTMVMATSYWQRLWVVQEVGLAQKIFFVYGPTLFTNEEAVRSAHQKRALKVSRGMRTMLDARDMRFTDTMRLETLVELFAGQICAEPRDKIYGLVGLANDVSAVESSSTAEDGRDDDATSIQYDGNEDVSFIIDYCRSFYDMWCDVVQYFFRCPHYFVPDHLDTDEGELARLRHQRLTNVVRFAAIVQNTLQDEVDRELTSAYTSPTVSEMNSLLRGPKLLGCHLVPARGYVAGKILDLGPSYADFVASFRHHTLWKAKWRKHYRKETDLMQLREMEERYATKILKYGDADVARIAPMEEQSFVAFRSPDNGPLDDLTAAGTHVNGTQIIDSMLAKLSVDCSSVKQAAPDGKVSRFLGTDYCMGLAPRGTVVGDWVLRFLDCDAAIVVRPHDTNDRTSVCALVGRADVADIRNREGPLSDSVAEKALTRHAYGDSEDKRVDMMMSWHTLQRITASVNT
ncbi:heterokaryon incompatibility protein-domain-containing protein [Xylaria sp. FL0043]|nr:heterokaryon incompatibility protein-domain-containing protein [Xylaria sp. FL0043]